jgi:alkylation response protein AidB-like acyl-CoA dehydrogenase
MSTEIDLEEFRRQARAWLRRNMELKTGLPTPSDAEDRQLQAKIADAGYAGLPYPVEYGGRGLTLRHQEVFHEEAAPYRLPVGLGVSLGMIAPTLLDCAAPEFLADHMPKILRGEEKWIQLLSEPNAGSDLAGSLTKADRDGDRWIVNGSKVWSTAAAVADYGFCLTRTDFDRPKHRGLSVFAMPLRAPGVTINVIVKSDGCDNEFYEEFFSDVALPADSLIGELNDGWSVAQRLLFHERNFSGGVGYAVGLRPKTRESVSIDDLIAAVRTRGTPLNDHDEDLLAQVYVNALVHNQLSRRVSSGYTTGSLNGPWGSLLKLSSGLKEHRRAEIAVELCGPAAVTWSDGSNNGPVGSSWLNAMVMSVAGGSNEMQRNTISEKLLGLPREPALDRDISFRESLRRRTPGGQGP